MLASTAREFLLEPLRRAVLRLHPKRCPRPVRGSRSRFAPTPSMPRSGGVRRVGSPHDALSRLALRLGWLVRRATRQGVAVDDQSWVGLASAAAVVEVVAVRAERVAGDCVAGPRGVVHALRL